MTTFVITRSTGYEKHVEAEDYTLELDYFWFRDAKNQDLFTIKASDVHSIERQTDKK